MTPKRVLVCGQRDYLNYEKVYNYLATFPPGTIVIHGNAPGADTFADQAAKDLNFEVLVFPAQWAKYGRAAGPVRNRQMLVEGHPDVVAAFYAKGGRRYSKGTNNMVTQAEKALIPVEIYEDEYLPKSVSYPHAKKGL